MAVAVSGFNPHKPARLNNLLGYESIFMIIDELARHVHCTRDRKTEWQTPRPDCGARMPLADPPVRIFQKSVTLETNRRCMAKPIAS